MILDDKKIKSVLIDEKTLNEKITELGKQISFDYKDKNLLAVGVLKGCFVFMADLMRKINIDCKIDFMCVSSYNKDTVSSGKVNIIKDLSIDIKGYDVLIIEDILDTGLTLETLIGILSKRKPASIKICTLLDKPLRRKSHVKADYSGFTIEDEFVIGYGLDFAEKYRNLPFIGIYNSDT